METCRTYRDGRYLNKVNEYGGLIKECGHAYMDIIDNRIIVIRSAKDSIRHLYTFEEEYTIIQFDMENSIPKEYCEEIINNFRKSFYSYFGPKFAENFANFDVFKRNALKLLSDIKKKIILINTNKNKTSIDKPSIDQKLTDK